MLKRTLTALFTPSLPLLFVTLASPAMGAADPVQKGEMAGYLLVPTGRVPETYGAGFSMYVASWPLLNQYPGQRFQTGLFGTWMFARKDPPPPIKLYSDIEGGLGWWRDDRLELWDKTLVIFAGDNGYHHNERNWWNKDTLFERSCRVPLIVAAPGAKAGQVCQGLVELVDFYPTVSDYCGVKAPHPLAGRSLRPLLEDPGLPGKDAAFTLVTRGQTRYGQAVRTDRWRYTRWSDGTAELYDEANDPEETRDLSADPRHRPTVEALQKLLDRIGPLRREPVGEDKRTPAKGAN